MASKLYQVKFEPGKRYHVFNHATGFDKLFLSDENKRYFLQRYAEYIEPVCKTFAYCLMNNHFHLLVEVRSEAELRAFFATRKQREVLPTLHQIVMQEFSNLCNAYAKAFNKQHKRRGALFLDYIRRIEIDTFAYTQQMVKYIHFNPIKHGFTDRVQDWQFSSFYSIITEKPSRLDRQTVLDWFGGHEAFLAVHNFDGSDWYKDDIDLEFGMY